MADDLENQFSVESRIHGSNIDCILDCEIDEINRMLNTCSSEGLTITELAVELFAKKIQEGGLTNCGSIVGEE